MRFPNRPHPLQSSRFWFMILACVAVTAMWKLGMFPGDSHQSGDFEEFAELDLSEDSGAFLADEDPTDSRGDASRDTSMTPPPGWASNAPPWRTERVCLCGTHRDRRRRKWLVACRSTCRTRYVTGRNCHWRTACRLISRFVDTNRIIQSLWSGESRVRGSARQRCSAGR